ncbi:site-specific integrase [Pseudodesulfovibrio sp. zrk46]|uniref:tyrosine-type recombinase/integrase n=1 Tax=Pseudodesulfovibrio sp. zrk46 TaxID=2725288 RepID=UPI0014493B95|nr:site-specific integrase [Pseudodesulfovibrio sp. zrk46]QJB55923.1 site-specific integrase [Pseudodesulfovibrio sp. zrk46]
MSRDWISSPKYTGVRWYKHPTRKHGVRFDRRFGIRFYYHGKQYESLLGWESDEWSEEKAFLKREEYLENVKKGQGPVSYRQELAFKKMENEKREAASAHTNTTFNQFFHKTYYPAASASWKKETARKHIEHVKNWLAPVVGDIPLKDITIVHVNKIKASMVEAKRAPRTMQYTFRTFSMVWESARDHGLVSGVGPTKAKSFKLPKIDNARERLLTKTEVERLLKAVRKRSRQAHNMALLSLESGMRFSEVARLSWGNVDLEKAKLRVINSKGDKSRTIPLTKRAVDILLSLDGGRNGDLVFPNSHGGIHKQIPSAFKRGVEDAKLNEDIHDPKYRFGFHGLRHTYASRLIESGAELIHVQRLLGHSTPVMTDRYSHLRKGNLRAIVAQMEHSVT